MPAILERKRKSRPVTIFSPAFIEACNCGDMGQVRRLLEENPLLARGWKPLMHASWHGHAEIVQCLLEYGADPDALSSSKHHYRPLHRAVEQKKSIAPNPAHLQVVRALLEGGADVTARATWRQTTPIALAAMGPEVRFLPLLLAYLSRWDIFHAAVLGEAQHVATLLRADPSLAQAVDQNGMTALHYCAASRLGSDDAAIAAELSHVATLLIDAGAEVNVAYRVGAHECVPPSHWAAGNRAVLDVLVHRGADVAPALNAALWESNFDVAEYVLQTGVDLQAQGIAEMVSTFSHWNRYSNSRWLIERGADPNGRDKTGRTALHWACRRGAGAAFVQFLLDHGASAGVHDAEGDTPLSLARAKHRTKLIELIEHHARPVEGL